MDDGKHAQIVYLSNHDSLNHSSFVAPNQGKDFILVCKLRLKGEKLDKGKLY